MSEVTKEKKATKPKAAPKAAPKGPTIADLSAQIDKLERCIAKMAHYQGGSIPRILKEFDIEEWSPDKSDMRKFKQG